MSVRKSGDPEIRSLGHESPKQPSLRASYMVTPALIDDIRVHQLNGDGATLLRLLAQIAGQCAFERQVEVTLAPVDQIS